jgi:general secretion pathway protein N
LTRVRAALAVLLLLAALAAVAAWTAPAELAYRLFGHRLKPLHLDGLSGTVWQGAAERSDALGQALGRLEWQVDRGALLSRRLDANLRVQGQDLRGSARVAAEADRVEVADLDGEFPASLLGPALDIPALTLLGRVSCRFSRLELQGGLPRRVDGTAVWRDLAVAGAATAALPGLEATFRTESDGLVAAEIKDLGGPLAIDGQVRMAGDRYRTEVRLNLREPNPALEEVLKFVGERTPEGGSILRVDGTLRPLR